MKKLLTLVLTIVLVFSMSAMIVSADDVKNFAEGAKWTKGHSGGVTEKDGAFKATGIDQPYKSPFVDILPAIKEALGTETEAELIIRFMIRADFKNGNEGEQLTAKPLLRGGNIAAEEVSDWNASFSEATEGDNFFKSDAGGNIMHIFPTSLSFTDEEWTPVIVELTVSDTVVNCDLVKNWNLCIDTIANPSIIEALYFKDLIVAEYDDSLFDIEEEAVEGADKEDKPTSDKPASNENFAANLTWTGFSGVGVTEKDGVITATGFKQPYSSPKIDVLPAFKKALGDEDYLEIYIVFDVRVTLTEGNEGSTVKANTLFRGTSTLDVQTSDVDAWKEAYADSFEDSETLFTNSQGNVMKYLGYGVIFNEEWQTVVILLEFEGEQITNKSISKWDFCFDGITDNKILNTMEIKNFQIVLEEPETEGDEGTDAKPDENNADENKPAENKSDPNATPTPYAVLATPIGYNNGRWSAPAKTNDVNLPLIIGCAAGAVVIIAAGAVIAVLAKKKKSSEPTEQ